LLDQGGHLRPVGPAIDSHADPATRADVRRAEEARRVGEDHRFLLAERRRQPHGQVVGTVMVIVELGEELASHAPRGLAPRDLLRRFGQGQADRA
jgi:hypothetical protein